MPVAWIHLCSPRWMWHVYSTWQHRTRWYYISSLLQEVLALRAEVRSLTAVRAEVAELKPCSQQCLEYTPVISDCPRTLVNLLVDISTATAELDIPKCNLAIEKNMQVDGFSMFNQTSATTEVLLLLLTPFATFVRNLQGTTEYAVWQRRCVLVSHQVQLLVNLRVICEWRRS